MTELREFPKHVARLHVVQWKSLMEKHGFTGDHLAWHNSPQKRHEAARPAYSLLPPPPGSRTTFKGKHGENISYQNWLKSQKDAWAARQNDPDLIDSIGIAATITLAKERFTGIVGDYFALWASETERDSDEFPQWLERLRQSVGNEIGDLWRKGEWHTAWFERACRRKVDDALCLLDKEWAPKARQFEIDRLESQDKLTFSGIDLEKANLGSHSYQDAFDEFEKNLRNGPIRKQSAQHVSPADSGIEEAGQTSATEDNTRMPRGEPSLTENQQDRTAETTAPSPSRHTHEIGDASVLPGEDRPAAKPRGRHGNQERRDAIRSAISKQGPRWREHLDRIFAELDRQEVSLGDFLSRQIDLGDGKTTKAASWSDLELAEGEQRRQIVDALRKYVD